MVRKLIQRNKLLTVAIVLTALYPILHSFAAKSMFLDFFDIITNLSLVASWAEYTERLMKTKLGEGNLLLSIFFALLLLGGTLGIFFANAYTMLIFYQNYIQ